VITNHGEKNHERRDTWQELVSAVDIYGGNTVEEAGKIFINILKGSGTWAQNGGTANSSDGPAVYRKYNDYDEAINWR
jgi:anthranilate phosphoribosyltransferase